MTSTSTRLLVCAALLFIACPGPAPETSADAGSGAPDSGRAQEPGPDAGLSSDAGDHTADAGASPDAGVADGGLREDSGTADAGLELDAGVVVDAGGADAGALDAAVADAGVSAADGGPCAGGNTGSGFSITSATSLPVGTAAFAISPFRVGPVYPRSPTTIDVFFSRAVNLGSGATLTNYSVTPPLAVSAANATQGIFVTLTTAPQTPGAAYTLVVTGVTAASDGALYPPATLKFTGYQFSFNAIAAGPGSVPREVMLIFSEPAACAPLLDPANFTVSGASVVSTSFLGSCTTSTRNVKLTLAHALSPGLHTVTGSSAIETPTHVTLGAPSTTFEGPSATGAFALFTVTALSATSLDVQFNEVPNAAGTVASNYSLEPSLGVVGAAQGTGSHVTLTTAAMSPNTVYTLTVTGVGPAQGAASATPMKLSLWSSPSFLLTQAFSLVPHQVKLLFSQSVGDAGVLPTTYQITGGASVASVGGVGLTATLALSGDIEGNDYGVVVSPSLTSAPPSSLPLATGHSGVVKLQLSSPASFDTLPRVYLGGVDLSVNQYLSTALDGLALYVNTGPLPSGSYELTVCGLENATHTAALRGERVSFTVP